MKSSKEQIGWYFYDWANSAFSATVVTVFFGPFITEIARNVADASGFIYPLGIRVRAGSFFPYIVSVSVLLQVFFLPILGAIADYSKLKKYFFTFFAYLGAFATMCMFFISNTHLLFGGILFIIANLSFGASIVFYNSFLPDISTPEFRDTVSSRGWAWGYLGGGILLALNLFFFSNAQKLGITTDFAVRISLFSAGLWWAVFSIIPLVLVKDSSAPKTLQNTENIFLVGFRQLKHTFGEMLFFKQTMIFLAAYLLYNDGVQSVIVLSSQFGREELGLSMQVLTKTILIVQFVAFFGSIFFGKVAVYIGAKKTILWTLTVWTLSVIYAYAFLKTETNFYFMAAIIGFVLGGSQALSRSLFSILIPKGKESEYFSLYEISERGTSWLGPMMFGLALQFTNSYRAGILSLIVFFVSGMSILFTLNLTKALNDLKAKCEFDKR